MAKICQHAGTKSMFQDEKVVRRIIYVLLLAIGPGFIFMIQVMVFVPPAMIFAGIPSMVWGHFTGEVLNVSFIGAGILLAHFLPFAGLYWILAFALGKLVTFFRQPSTTKVVFGLVLVGILGLSQFSIYGGGGHGPGSFGPIQSLLVESSFSSERDLYSYIYSVTFFVLVAVAVSIISLRRS